MISINPRTRLNLRHIQQVEKDNQMKLYSEKGCSERMRIGDPRVDRGCKQQIIRRDRPEGVCDSGDKAQSGGRH